MNIQWIGTPDFTNGHKAYDYIVMHWGVTSKIEQIDSEVLNPNREMSYHYALSDNTVHQYVDEKNTAWHAGVWDINQRSIGICINAGPNNPYTDQDYETSAQLCADIIRRHGTPIANIAAHRDFKATECPGGLDFGRLRGRVNEILNPPPPPPAPVPTPTPAPEPVPAPNPIPDTRDQQIADLTASNALLNKALDDAVERLSVCQNLLTIANDKNDKDKKDFESQITELSTTLETEKKLKEEFITQIANDSHATSVGNSFIKFFSKFGIKL